MPRSPSRKVMALVVDAVFMNAGSSVTRPEFDRRLEMSTPFSCSVPSTTSRSISCFPIVMRTVSGTASLPWRLACALALSRGAAKESSAEPAEQFAHGGGRIAEIIGGGERCTLSQAPGDRADADARRLAGRQIDPAVPYEKRFCGLDLQLRAEAQQTLGRGLARHLVAAQHGAKGGGDAEPLQDLARETSGFVRQDGPCIRRQPQQLRDARVQPGAGQQALRVLLAPDRRGLRMAAFVDRPQGAADQALPALADEAVDGPRVE